jgi:hypothetical protein
LSEHSVVPKRREQETTRVLFELDVCLRHTATGLIHPVVFNANSRKIFINLLVPDSAEPRNCLVIQQTANQTSLDIESMPQEAPYVKPHRSIMVNVTTTLALIPLSIHALFQL